MGEELTEEVTLETHHCPVCGVVFALPKHLIASKRESGDGFHCPSGHQLHFKDSKSREIEQLKSQLSGKDDEIAVLRSELDQSRTELSRTLASRRWGRKAELDEPLEP